MTISPSNLGWGLALGVATAVTIWTAIDAYKNQSVTVAAKQWTRELHPIVYWTWFAFTGFCIILMIIVGFHFWFGIDLRFWL